ncbi:MAG: putative glycoside hydrolase [bacterium]
MKVFLIFLVTYMLITNSDSWCNTSNNIDLVKKVRPPFPRIANCYGVGLMPDSSDKDIDEIAKFDLLIGGVWCDWNNDEQVKKLKEKVTEIRRKNPNIIILDFSVSAPYADPNDPTFPESGWLKQPDGKYIDGWPGTRMINLTKPETIEWIVKQCINSMKKEVFDGVFIDSMAGAFDWWVCNIETKQNYQIDADEDGKADYREWLDKEWEKAKTEIVKYVRDAIGDKAVFMTNQGGEWSFSDTNGVLFEDNLDYVLDGNSDWENILKSYLFWTETSYQPNITTIVSSSGIEPPYNPWKTLSAEDRFDMLEKGRNLHNRMRFGLATTLMGNGYFAYDLHTRWRGQRWWYQEYDAPLGFPKGSCNLQRDGTWRRDFDNGTVIVNPTVLDSQVQFEHNYLDISSGKIGSSFIVPSYDGRIFIKSEEDPKPGNINDPDPLFTLSGEDKILCRSDKILCRLNNLVALFDKKGKLLSLTDGKDIFASNIRANIVNDERWVDFEYEDCSFQIIDRDTLLFSGKRVKDNTKLSYEQTVKLLMNGITINYNWESLTDGNIHSWRQQIDFPVSQYSGGTFVIDGIEYNLPAKPEKSILSEQKTYEIIMVHPKGAKVSVKASVESYILDERVYNGKEYRIFFLPIGYGNKAIKTGNKWKYDVNIIYIPND